MFNSGQLEAQRLLGYYASTPVSFIYERETTVYRGQVTVHQSLNGDAAVGKSLRFLWQLKAQK